MALIKGGSGIRSVAGLVARQDSILTQIDSLSGPSALSDSLFDQYDSLTQQITDLTISTSTAIGTNPSVGTSPVGASPLGPPPITPGNPASLFLPSSPYAFNGDTSSPPRPGKLEIEDNILSGFESSTYKWTLYAAAPDIHNSKVWTGNRDDNLVIISESGAQGDFFITDMEVTNIVGIQSHTRFMPHASFNFTVEEPLGVSFMDHIKATAAQLGVSNHLRVPYYLELIFFGDNGEINVVDRGLRWSVTLVNMAMSTNESGSSYQFEAIQADDAAVINDAAVTAQSYPLDNVATVGDVFSKLGQQINEYEHMYQDLLYNVSDSYEFCVAPEIASLRLSPADSSQNTQRTAEGPEGDTRQIVVPAGMDISEFAANLMVISEGWEININATGIHGAISSIDFSKLWKVETEVMIKEYDFRRNDYAKHYIYNLIPYSVLRSNSNVSEDEQIRRATALTSSFNVNKLYNYIFTGQNTEVLSFDFHIDFMWLQTLPYGLEVLRLDGSDVDLGSFLNSAAVSGANINALTSLLSSSVGRDRIQILNEIREETQFRNSLIDPVTGRTFLDLLGNGQTLPNTVTQRTYIEDIPKLRNRYDFSSPPPEKVTRARSDVTQHFSIEGGGLSHTQNIIANYLSFHGSAEMTNAELEIKGDPYWFGVSKFMRTTPICGGGDEGTSRLADYMHRDNMFVIKLNAPAKPGEDGLYHTPDDNRLYTALYQVWQANHKFSNGMYTTTLSGIRDNQTNISEILKDL